MRHASCTLQYDKHAWHDSSYKGRWSKETGTQAGTNCTGRRRSAASPGTSHAGLRNRPTGIVRLFPPAGYQGFHDGALRENSAPWGQPL